VENLACHFEVIIAEQQFDVVLASTGRRFTSSFLLVLRVRDGLIVHTRDYADTLRTAQGTGRLPALLASLSTQPTP
jgi:ketosteroid isomerase-like protein